MTTTRTAKVSDFKVGATLTTQEGYNFTITSKYDDGIWEARGESGSKCIFEGEARFYTIEDDSILNNSNVAIEYDANKSNIFARDLRDTNNDPAFFTKSKRGITKVWEEIKTKFTDETTMHDLMNLLYERNIKYHYWCMMD